jgi:hypothetical protein
MYMFRENVTDPGDLDEIAREQVARGVAALDRLARSGRLSGDWRDRISLEVLDIDNEVACPLGQVFGLYSRGCEELGIEAYGGEQNVALGFMAVSDEHAAALRDAWQAVLGPEVAR